VSLSYVERGLKPPQLVLRGHAHRIDDSGHKLPNTRALVLPCWQLRTAFGYKVAANNTRADIGGAIFTIENGRYSFDDSRLRYMAAPGQQRIIKA
jgi:hypothetical protein